MTDIIKGPKNLMMDPKTFLRTLSPPLHMTDNQESPISETAWASAHKYLPLVNQLESMDSEFHDGVAAGLTYLYDIFTRLFPNKQYLIHKLTLDAVMDIKSVQADPKLWKELLDVLPFLQQRDDNLTPAQTGMILAFIAVATAVIDDVNDEEADAVKAYSRPEDPKAETTTATPIINQISETIPPTPIVQTTNIPLLLMGVAEQTSVNVYRDLATHEIQYSTPITTVDIREFLITAKQLIDKLPDVADAKLVTDKDRIFILVSIPEDQAC